MEFEDIMNDNWPLVPLGEILTKSEETTEIELTKTYRRVTVRLWGRGAVLRDEVDGAQISAKKQSVIHPQQFLISRIDARHGASAIVPDFLNGAIVSNDFPTFHLNHARILPDFLGWLSKTITFVELCKTASEGTTNRVRLKLDRFLAMEIPLPPLDEQHRIVARIEELAAKVEQAQELRRQSVAEVEVLLPNVFSIGYDEAARMAGGTERLDDLCHKITDGTHSTPAYVDEGVPFLSVKDITSGTIRFDAVRYITPEEHAFLTKRCKPEFGDVLLTKVGTTGFAKAIDVDREFSIFVSLALLKIDRDRLDSKFTEYMLNSSRLREYSKEGTRGVGNKNLVLKFIREFPMPAPPLSEQRRIVAYLDRLQTKMEAVKRHQATTAARLDALLPSILDQAFKGAL